MAASSDKAIAAIMKWSTRKRRASPEPVDPGERRILGTVLLRDGALLLQTNSVERAAAILSRFAGYK